VARLPFFFVLVIASALAGSTITPPSAPPGDPGQVFVLRDYRWVPVIVKRTPTAIECRFDVVTGSPTVSVELLSDREFALFSRGRDYDTLAETPIARSGELRHMIQTAGRYRVLIRNDRGAPPVAVSLLIRTDVDPQPATMSKGVSPARKLVIILASLMLFFGTVFWSGSKLMRAYRNRPQVIN
jgi:hypothetical protein